MNRDALAAAMEHIHRLRDFAPQYEAVSEAARAIYQRQQLSDGFLGSAASQAIRAAESTWLQAELESAQLRAMRDLMPSLTDLTEQSSTIQGFLDSFEAARAYLPQSSVSFLWFARESLNAFLHSAFSTPVDLFRDPARWIEEELDRLLVEGPEFRNSKLAWILVMFVPRFRLALYHQDREGDFDGVMKTLWEDLLGDPEVRAQLRKRLEESGVRDELRQSLSKHLDTFEKGELMYAIIGLYAHIEGFLAEIAVERGLIPDPNSILLPDGKREQRQGVWQLIELLHASGQIDDSQAGFLKFVLSNHYQANRVRHGSSYDFTQERATALVLALILILCLSLRMEPDELLDADAAVQDGEWLDELLEDDLESSETAEDVAQFIDEIVKDGEAS